MSELRLGLIGCGRIAERGYVPAALRARGIRLAAVADPVAERCARAAPGVPSFGGAAELLAARAADVLVLATPAAAHVPDARLAAAAGVPTLVEKPPAPTAGEAAELAAISPPPWIGFNRRFEPALELLRERARAEEHVELFLLLATLRRSWAPYEVNDGVLLDLGPHLVDLALWLSQAEPERVSARVQPQRVSLLIELAGGRGVARIECVGNRPYRERIEIRASRRLVARFECGGLRRGLAAALGRSGGKSPLVDSLTRQLESFARAAGGASEPDLATATDGVRVMQTLEAALHAPTA